MEMRITVLVEQLGQVAPKKTFRAIEVAIYAPVFQGYCRELEHSLENISIGLDARSYSRELSFRFLQIFDLLLVLLNLLTEHVA